MRTTAEEPYLTKNPQPFGVGGFLLSISAPSKPRCMLRATGLPDGGGWDKKRTLRPLRTKGSGEMNGYFAENARSSTSR